MSPSAEEGHPPVLWQHQSAVEGKVCFKGAVWKRGCEKKRAWVSGTENPEC